MGIPTSTPVTGRDGRIMPWESSTSVGEVMYSWFSKNIGHPFVLIYFGNEHCQQFHSSICTVMPWTITVRVCSVTSTPTPLACGGQSKVQGLVFFFTSIPSLSPRHPHSTSCQWILTKKRYCLLLLFKHNTKFTIK